MPITLTKTSSLSNRPQLYRYPIDQQYATDEIIAGLSQPQKTLHHKYFYDAEGARIQTLAVGAGGHASGTFPATVGRDRVPWRLHLPRQQARHRLLLDELLS